MSLRDITLVLTNECNLNCVYCYECNKNTGYMNTDTIQRILDEELKKDDDELNLNLFGGEPFLRFDSIKYIVSYLKASRTHKRWNVNIITNGTLVHGYIQNWLLQNRDVVHCTLSADGKKEVHDRNRSNSYNKIDFSFFKTMCEKPIAKMTVSEYTLLDLADNIIYLNNMGFRVNCTLAYGTNWNQGMLEILDNQLEKYFEYAIKNGLQKEDSSLLSFPYKEIYYSKEKYYKNCDAGVGKNVYDTDGKIYPCHMFLPNGLSEYELNQIDNISFPDTEIERDCLDSKCIDCPLYSVCQSCFANNFKKYGDIYHQDENICKANKIIFRQKAIYAAKIWDIETISEEIEEYMLLDSITRIMEMRVE